MQRASVERAFDLDRPRHPLRAANQQVAGAVDGKARVIGEPLGEDVREQALRQPATVQLDPGWTRDDAPREVHLDALPSPRGTRCGRFARRRERQRRGQRDGVPEIARVAGLLDAVDERGVDETVGQRGGDAHRLRQARHHRAHRHLPAWILVQERELAAREKAREALVPALQPAPDELDGLLRGTLATGACHEGRAGGAKAVEAIADLADAHHDCDVVTGLTGLLDSPLLDSVPADSAPSEDSLLCVSPELVACDDSAEVLVVAAAAVLLFFDVAESAGSWPEASWT